MPRAKIYGYILTLAALIAGGYFLYNTFYNTIDFSRGLASLNSPAYYAISIPIGLLFTGFLGTGFWIGWTILTIKVAPPMPEIVEKKDFAKPKAFLLCLMTLTIAVFFGYGVYIKSYWALAIPATAITLVILGMIFWIGIAIITTRTTLPVKEKE